MARRSTSHTQADITRLIKAALAAGIGAERIAGVKLTKDSATILFGDAKTLQTGVSNEWDEVLE